MLKILDEKNIGGFKQQLVETIYGPIWSCSCAEYRKPKPCTPSYCEHTMQINESKKAEEFEELFFNAGAYEFLFELKELMNKHNLKSITPMTSKMFIGYTDEEPTQFKAMYGSFQFRDK